MHFATQQAVGVPPARAMAAYGTPSFYEGRPIQDHIEVLEVVRHEDTGARVLMEVRFAFRGPISPAVQRVIDRNKMSWITRNELRPDESRADWVVLPDHYPDRLSAGGVYRFETGDGAGRYELGRLDRGRPQGPRAPPRQVRREGHRVGAAQVLRGRGADDPRPDDLTT